MAMTEPSITMSGAGVRKTEFSPCRCYRYTLWREWLGGVLLLPDGASPDRYLMVIGLNPSTADETQDDPTIRRCIGFAKRWGFGALCMTNLFAWRDTLPANMKKAPDPIGVDNGRWLCEIAENAGMVLAAWGKDGRFLDRDAMLLSSLKAMNVQVHALKINKDGTPMHPLYAAGDTVPVLFAP